MLMGNGGCLVTYITQDVAALLFTGRLTLYSEMRAGLIDVEGYESYHS